LTKTVTKYRNKLQNRLIKIHHRFVTGVAIYKTKL